MTTVNGTPGIELRGVDIFIRPGEIVALLGPNGAGKSTTIDMLLGLAEPDAAASPCSAAPPPTRRCRGWSARCSRPAC